jgi:polyisoprenoid-binding protein YceI
MSKKSWLLLTLLTIIYTVSHGQDKYYTKSGKIEFSSKATMEDIDAKNKTVSAILDPKTGALQFSVLMKSFEFEKALMQEHFNSDYVESDKYPKAEFKGTIVNNSGIDYTKDGTYPVKVKGQLTMHGATRAVEPAGTIKIDGGKVSASSSFTIKLSDYNITIPAIVKDKISKTIDVTVDCKLEPFKG